VEINTMIATAEITDTQIRSEFENMLPELVSRFRCRFLSNGSDLQDEHTAEAVALSWATYLSARRRGREPNAGNLAWYSARCVLSGRRLTGSTSLDAMSETRTARERIGKHVSLNDFKGDPQRTFYTTFGDRRWRWPVIDVVGAKLDWQSFMSRFDQRDQRIIELKLGGQSQVEIADEIGVSPAFISQQLRAMRRRWDNMQAVV
jgi:hypothetical protein